MVLSNAALIHAYHSDCQTRNPQSTVLDRLSILLSAPYRGGGDPYLQHSLYWETYISGTTSHGLRCVKTNIKGFLVLAVIYGLVAYVREKLKHQFSSRPIEASYASMLHYIPSITTNS